ncbi:hypothetical protein COCNU_scaffold003034G000020 [Cocos nucifera]|nr:hypothetical protein [Cocos nucifera]
MMKDKGLELIAEKGSCSASSRFSGRTRGTAPEPGEKYFETIRCVSKSYES